MINSTFQTLINAAGLEVEQSTETSQSGACLEDPFASLDLSSLVFASQPNGVCTGNGSCTGINGCCTGK